jgi:hypothetical protein
VRKRKNEVPISCPLVAIPCSVPEGALYVSVMVIDMDLRATIVSSSIRYRTDRSIVTLSRRSQLKLTPMTRPNHKSVASYFQVAFAHVEEVNGYNVEVLGICYLMLGFFAIPSCKITILSWPCLQR